MGIASDVELLPDVCILGPFQLGRAPRSIGAHVRVVLSALTLHRPHPVSNDFLGEAVWEGNEWTQVALRILMTRSRKALTEGEVSATLGSSPNGYLIFGEFLTDAMLLEKAVAECEIGDFTEDHVRSLQVALGLWRGSPYQELANIPAAIAERHRLEEVRFRAKELLIDALWAVGQQAEALQLVRSLAADEPLRDSVVERQMRLLWAAGRQVDALHTFDQFRVRLADDLGLQPSPKLKELEGEILRQEVNAIPKRSRGSPAQRPSGADLSRALRQRGAVIPITENQFVGRNVDLEHLSRMVSAHRSVTLLGPGGIGKTRLASEFARTQETAICWVDLSVHGPSELLSAIASGLGLSWTGSQPSLVRVVEALENKQMLLVIDNCEHSLDELGPIVESIVQMCPGVRILSTSRAPLRIPSEHVLSVGPLSKDAAHMLFLVRQQQYAVSDQSVLEEARSKLLLEGCDGLPLAIELTASSFRFVVNNDQPFPDLAYPSASFRADPRHRGFSASVNYTLEGLSLIDRQVFCHLGAMSGRFELNDAIECTSIEEHSLRQSLSRLIENSLLTVDPADGITCFRLLEPIRAAALDGLKTAGELDGARRRHALSFAGSVQREALALDSCHEAHAAARLERVDSQIRCTWSWALDNDGSLGLDLGASLSEHAFARMHDSYFGWLTRFVDLPGLDLQRSYPDALGGLATAAWARSDVPLALKLAHRSLEISERTGGKPALLALRTLQNVAGSRGISEEAIKYFFQVANWTEKHGDVRHQSDLKVVMAIAYAQSGDKQNARLMANAALHLAESSGIPSALAWAEYVDAFATLGSGDSGCIQLFHQAIERAGAIRNRVVQGMAMAGLATAKHRFDHLDESEELLRSLISFWHRANMLDQLAAVLANFAIVSDRLGKRDRALAALELRATIATTHPLFPDEQEALRALERRNGTPTVGLGFSVLTTAKRIQVSTNSQSLLARCLS